MKKTFSVLALFLLVFQSFASSLVYAQDVPTNEPDSVSAVETAVVESVSEESSIESTIFLDASEDTSEEVSDVVSDKIETPSDVVEVDVDEGGVTSDNVIDDEVIDEEVIDEEIVEEISNEIETPSDVEEVVDVNEGGMTSDNVVEEEVVEEEIVQQSWRKTTWNGLVVNAVDSLGAFPQGTEMYVKTVSESKVIDLISDAIDETVSKVMAVDITFKYNGEEIEPTKPINVSISAGNINESQIVLHIDDEENVQEIDSVINDKTIEFEADGFSIYVIAETSRLLVNFYNGENVIMSGYVKSASEVESLVFDPGVGELGEKQVFLGWTTEENYTTETVGMTIEQVQTDIESRFPLSDNEELNLYAMIFTNYTVKYQGIEGIVVHTEEVLFKGDNGDSVSYKLDYVYETNDFETNFQGWIYDGTTYSNLSNIDIVGDVSLLADVPSGHWLVFDENGKGAKYNAPQFVKNGTTTVRPCDDSEMIRNGYTFGGWYTDKDCTDGNKFTFGNAIDEYTTIYAKWTAAETANYTVLIWKQNVDGDGYDFVESVTVENATVGSTPSAVNLSNGMVQGGTYNGEVGFSYKRTDQAEKTVATEGNTVVNVYYDRNNITFIFNVYDYAYTKSDSISSAYYYVKNESGGYEQIYLYYNSGRWYKKRTGNHGNYKYSDEYVGDRYTRSSNRSWREYKTMSGLYGSTLADNNFEWPNEYDWYAIGYNGGSVGGTRTTFLDAFLPTSAETIVNFYADEPEGSKHIYFYKQNADGNGYTLANTVNTSANGFNLSDKYNGFKCVAWNTSNNISNRNEVGELMDRDGQYYYDADPNNGGYQTASIGSNGLHIYFDRKEYSILFYDGAYVDGNGNLIDESSQGQFGSVSNIAYGANIGSYNRSGNNFYEPEAPAGYVFEGWYLDDNGTSAYTFTTMPEGGLTVYAKWREIQYRVFLHPNAGTDETLDWGSTGQKMNFRISFGKKVSAPTGLRSGYDFVGRYQDENFTKMFNADAFVLNETTVTTPYDKTTDFTDPMDKWGNGATSNNDVDRFRVTKKLDLYAKWSKKLDGADGVVLLYDAAPGTLNGIDNKLYIDGAEASVLPAPTAPDGKQFRYWIVNKWNGTTYVDTDTTVYPGETFTINSDRAEVEDVDCEDAGQTGCKKYTIKLVASYDTIGEPETTTIEYYDGTELIDTQTVNVNEEFTIHAALEKVGYKFIEWNASENGDGIGYSAGVTGHAADNQGIQLGEANKLYAKWECDAASHYESDGNNGCKLVQYNVTFVDEDETTVLKEATAYDYGTPAAQVVAPDDPTKESTVDYTYTFAGWAPTIVDVTADAIYKASYTEATRQYTVTFDSDGGSTVENQVVDYNSTATKPANPTKRGFSFKGWYFEEKAFDFNTPITADITLVAKWNRNGGGGGGGNGGGGGGGNDEEVTLSGQVDECTVAGSPYPEEWNEAFLYACENEITSIKDINDARLEDIMNRAEMAKFVTKFALVGLKKTPNNMSKDCSNFADSIASYNTEMKNLMVLSCKFEYMGIHTVDYEPIPDFMPAKFVSRAEFGTVLSRILWGDTYEGTNENYYSNHLNNLKSRGIITQIDPNIQEKRGYVLLMIYRSAKDFGLISVD